MGTLFRTGNSHSLCANILQENIRFVNRDASSLHMIDY